MERMEDDCQGGSEQLSAAGLAVWRGLILQAKISYVDSFLINGAAAGVGPHSMLYSIAMEVSLLEPRPTV